jgi:hypothetical protein
MGSDNEDPEIADVAQDILNRHYWPAVLIRVCD